jgi:hypothetical protein
MDVMNMISVLYALEQENKAMLLSTFSITSNNYLQIMNYGRIWSKIYSLIFHVTLRPLGNGKRKVNKFSTSYNNKLDDTVISRLFSEWNQHSGVRKCVGKASISFISLQ